jgi:hypothetical protein
MKARWLLATCLTVWLGAQPVCAHHELDLLFGYENGYVTIIQPEVHPVRQMVTPQQGTFLLDVGMDFFVPDGWLGFMLQRCRVQQVWISPGIVGNKSGIGTVFSAGNTPNYYDLPFGGTPHHHFIFAASSPGVYVFDLKAIRGVDYQGRSLFDMPFVYRIYMVAGSPSRLYGSVTPSPWYVGSLYDLFLRLQVRRDGNVVASTEQPVNPWAIYPYLAGFNTSGNVQVVAKLDKHLSVRVSRNLSGSQRQDWTFAKLGDTNGDDLIDSNDLRDVVNHFGGVASHGDLTGDGTVNLDDLYPVLVYYGQSGEGMR